MGITRITIDIEHDGSYDCVVGAGCISSIGQRLRNVKELSDCERIMILTDSNVGPLHAASLKDSLTSSGLLVDQIVVPAGESSKCIAAAEEIWSALSQLGFDRHSVVCALGGGVIGDLAGFVSATYMRGIPVVQIPTSLLAMVDSSIGGKTAINIPEGKNLVGAFHQPSAVISDIAFLDSLDDAQMRCGLAEVAKSSLLSNDDFFFWLDATLPSEWEGRRSIPHDALHEMVVRSVVFKAGIVAADPLERNDCRVCLNLGHTFGHALEACAGYGTYSHGECVAEGMRFAARIAESELGSSPEFTSAQDALLDKIGLPKLAYDVDSERMLTAMRSDKKNIHDAVRFVLLQDLGKPQLHTIESGLLKEYLEVWKEMGA